MKRETRQKHPARPTAPPPSQKLLLQHQLSRKRASVLELRFKKRVRRCAFNCAAFRESLKQSANVRKKRLQFQRFSLLLQIKLERSKILAVRCVLKFMDTRIQLSLELQHFKILGIKLGTDFCCLCTTLIKEIVMSKLKY